MAEQTAEKREGLSLQTLVVAAIASGVAAIVVSHFWQGGTVLAAAMTPVIVSVLKEALRRPMESEVVRRSASRVSKVATAALPTTTGAGGSSPSTSTLPPPPGRHANGNGNGGHDARDVVVAGPRRTYSSAGKETTGRRGGLLDRLRGRPLKIAIVTGLLAFVVAVAALTVPELIFGGSVTSGGGRTTIFGGGSGSSTDQKTKDEKSNDGNSGDSGQQDSSTQQQQQDSSTQPDGTASPPQDTQTQPDDTQTQPDQTQPPPSGSQPPSSGGTPATPVPAPTPPTP